MGYWCHLPGLVKYKNLISPYIHSLYPIYTTIVKYFLYIHWEPHQSVIIFALLIRYNLENSRGKVKLILFSHIFAHHSLYSFLVVQGSFFFIILFLFRELPLAILWGWVFWGKKVLLTSLHLRMSWRAFIPEGYVCRMSDSGSHFFSFRTWNQFSALLCPRRLWGDVHCCSSCISLTCHASFVSLPAGRLSSSLRFGEKVSEPGFLQVRIIWSLFSFLDLYLYVSCWIQCIFSLYVFRPQHLFSSLLGPQWHESCCLVNKSCLTPLQPYGVCPARRLCPWDFPGKNIGVGCHRGSPRPRDRTSIACISRWISTTEPPGKPYEC